MKYETTFSINTSSIKFGSGVTREVGYEMRRLGAKRVMVVTDPGLADSEAVNTTLKSIAEEDIDVVLYADVEVEPTDISFKHASAFATDGCFDAYVAVGGGSSMDTAKAANLYATYPDEFLSYVNAPIGDAKSVPGPLKPLVAIPTTTGTGSETTGVAIFDFIDMKTKTGISDNALRPTIGLIDPDHTKTLPNMVAASSGLDVLCHGLESYTAKWYMSRQAPEDPSLRPGYQGSNPISDVWAIQAITMVAKNIVRAVNDPDSREARSEMLLAATMAGVGFGNAGVHLPHGMSYPVAGMVKEYRPDGYPSGHALVPHGISVAINAPSVFRFTGPSNPERHLEAAKLMGADISAVGMEEAGDVLAETVIELMRKIGVPNGLQEIGYDLDDVDALVEGTLPQHRVTKLSPRDAERSDLKQLFIQSMKLW